MGDLKHRMPRYERYKDSGVEWIGEIPVGWGILRLKFIATIIVSNVDKVVNDFELPVTLCNYVDVYKNSYITNELPFMRGTATKEEISRYRLYQNDVLITKDSEDWLDIGVPALVRHESSDFLCGYHLAILRATHKVMGDFLYWNLLAQYSRVQFSIRANGITRYGISHGGIKNILLIIPPTSSQTAIANFLDCKTQKIDQAIAIKEKQINLLKERKQILIQEAVTRGLDPNAPMRDSGVEWIGEIPRHWGVKKLKYLFSEVNERTETGIEKLFSLRMGKGLIPHNEVSTKHIADKNLINYKIVKPGQLVMNRMRASIGIFGLVYENGLVSPDYAVFLPHEEGDSQYYLLMFKTMLLGTQFRLNSKGMGTGSSGFMRLYTENFGNIKVPCPSVYEQKAIVSHIQTQSAKIDKAIAIQQQMIEKLREYKATLINSAVTGKIKVPGLESKKEVA